MACNGYIQSGLLVSTTFWALFESLIARHHFTIGHGGQKKSYRVCSTVAFPMVKFDITLTGVVICGTKDGKKNAKDFRCNQHKYVCCSYYY